MLGIAECGAQRARLDSNTATTAAFAQQEVIALVIIGIGLWIAFRSRCSVVVLAIFEAHLLQTRCDQRMGKGIASNEYGCCFSNVLADTYLIALPKTSNNS